MRNEGLGSWPARRARKTPRAAALVHEGRTLTYADLLGRVARLAHALRGLGSGPATGSPTSGPNHPSFLETLFATGMLGGIFVPLNTRLAAPEIAYQLDDSGASVLIHGPSHADLVDGLPGGREHIALDAYEEMLTARTATRWTSRRARRPLHDHVHVRDDRAGQGRDAHPRQHHLERDQRPHRPRPGRLRGGARVGAAVPHRRAQHAHAAGPAQGRDVRARPSVRPGRDARPDRGAADHVHVRGADDVPAGRPRAGLGRRRPLLAAHPDVRRRPRPAVPDRDLPGAGPDVPAGLRHDRGRSRRALSTPSTPCRRRARPGCRTSSATCASSAPAWRTSHRARPARSSSRARTSCAATGDGPATPPPCSATAGSAAATPPASTPTAMRSSSTESRT